MDKPLSTADVPPHFLRAVLLVGPIPFKALASDPRVSYGLYVPPTHYNPDPAKTTTSDVTTKKLPLLVNVHSTKRDVSALYRELAYFAEETPCAVLAPLFPAGIDGPNDIDSYKTLKSRTLRSDLALLSILDEVAQRWPGIETRRVFMMGYSGGGQFVHRFLYLYPERLAAISIGAPGRSTFLDEQQAWPRGVADVRSIFGRDIERELIKKVNIQLLVGGADTGVHGGKEFWEWLQQVRKSLSHNEDGASGSGNTHNGLPAMEKGRLEGVKQLHQSWEQDGIEAQFDIIEGVAHEGDKVRGLVLAYLQPRIQTHRQQ